MAKTLENAVDDVLKCAICRDVMKYPKVLSCLHSFCRDCLKQLIDNSREDNFRCPMCNMTHRIPEKGADGFQTNFVFINLLEARKVSTAEHELQGIKCENGLDENRGVARCIDCECFLCETCCVQHTKLKATRSHRIIPLADIKNDVRKLEYKRMCFEHEGEELKLFCTNCEEVICRDCTIVNHKGHECQFVKDICDQLKSEIRTFRDGLGGKCREFDQHLHHLEQVKEASDQNIQHCRDHVEEYFEEAKRKLDQVKDQLLAELVVAQGERSKQLQVQEEIVETSKAKLESAKEFTEQLLDKGIPVDVAMMYQQTKNRYESLKGEQWDSNSAQPSRWVFVADENDPLKSRVRGGISRSDLTVEGLGQPVPGLNKFRVCLDAEIDVTHSNLVVTAMNIESGEQLPNVEIIRMDRQNWEVSYTIKDDGRYLISVILDGIEAQKSPFLRQWKARLLQGMKVTRGNDWKWGDQDGGVGGIGVVMGWSDEVGASNKWAKIKWDATNRQNNYRWGAEGAYDLQVVPQQS